MIEKINLKWGDSTDLLLQLNELKALVEILVDYNYDDEENHFYETIDDDGKGGEDHIFHTITELRNLIQE